MLVIGCANSTIPSTVVGIGDFAFSESSITSITLPANIVTLGVSAFNRCSDLSEVIIEGEITSIPSFCFYECRSLVNITIPSSVTTLGDNAFSDTRIIEITIPSGVTMIGGYCFNYCSNLSERNTKWRYRN